jgi:hypothetical protein
MRRLHEMPMNVYGTGMAARAPPAHHVEDRLLPLKQTVRQSSRSPLPAVGRLPALRNVDHDLLDHPLTAYSLFPTPVGRIRNGSSAVSVRIAPS